MRFLGVLLMPLLLISQSWALPGEIALISETGQVFIAQAKFPLDWHCYTLSALVERDSELSHRRPWYEVFSSSPGRVQIMSLKARLQGVGGIGKPEVEFGWPGAESPHLSLHIDGDRTVYFHNTHKNTLQFATIEDNGRVKDRIRKVDLGSVGKIQKIVAHPYKAGALLTNKKGELFYLSRPSESTYQLDLVHTGAKSAELWLSGNAVLFWTEREWGFVNGGNRFVAASDKQLPNDTMRGSKYWIVPASAGSVVEWLRATPDLPAEIVASLEEVGDRWNTQLQEQIKPLRARYVEGGESTPGAAAPVAQSYSTQPVDQPEATGKPTKTRRKRVRPQRQPDHRIRVRRAAGREKPYLIYDRVTAGDGAFTLVLPAHMLANMKADSGGLVDPIQLDLELPADGVWVNYGALDREDRPAVYHFMRAEEFRGADTAATGEILVRKSPWNNQEALLFRQSEVSTELFRAATSPFLRCASELVNQAKRGS